MTNDEVIDRFLAKGNANSTNLHSNNLELKSYAMPIAKWELSELYVYQGNCPSKTTTIHRNKLIKHCKINGIRYKSLK